MLLYSKLKYNDLRYTMCYIYYKKREGSDLMDITATNFIKTTRAYLDAEENLIYKLPEDGFADKYEHFLRKNRERIISILQEQKKVRGKEAEIQAHIWEYEKVKMQWKAYKSTTNKRSMKIKPKTRLDDARDKLTKQEKAYMTAQRFATSTDFDKVKIGEDAKQKIVVSQSGYDDILIEMLTKWEKHLVEEAYLVEGKN